MTGASQFLSAAAMKGWRAVESYVGHVRFAERFLGNVARFGGRTPLV